MANCKNDHCDNDPNEYILCDRWQSGNSICRGSHGISWRKWLESQECEGD